MFRSKRISHLSSFLLVASLGMIGLGTGCSGEESKPENQGTDISQLPSLGADVVELRGSGTGTPETRYLGYGFDLLKHRVNDEMGFSTHPIVRLDNLTNGVMKNPWKVGRPSDYIAPSVELNRLSGNRFDEITKLVVDVCPNDTMTLNFGVPMRDFTRIHSYASSHTPHLNANYAHYYSYNVKERVSLSFDKESDLQYYLDPRFVSHLYSLSAEQLIDYYGTHLVTEYDLGPFLDFMLVAHQEVFSRDEMYIIAANALGAIPTLPESLKEKMYKALSSLKIVYRQGGSDYLPNITAGRASLGSNLIDTKKWKEQLRVYDGTFMSLPRDVRRLVPIPDLIEPLPLKLKYISAILHRLNPNSNIIYILSDPRTYQPIKYKGEYVYVPLSKYENSGCYVRYGSNHSNDLSEKELTGSGSLGTGWWCSLSPDGLWAFYLASAKKYLCTDLVLRTLEEDSEGLRYWGLNPIVPREGYSQKAWGQRVIRPE